MTKEQKKVGVVAPAEEQHDTRICIEDLVDTDFDESDVDELRAEKKGHESKEQCSVHSLRPRRMNKQPGDGTQRPMKEKSSANSRQKSELSEADFKLDELHKALNEPPGARARVALTGPTLAVYFRDAERGKDKGCCGDCSVVEQEVPCSIREPEFRPSRRERRC